MGSGLMQPSLLLCAFSIPSGDAGAREGVRGAVSWAHAVGADGRTCSYPRNSDVRQHGLRRWVSGGNALPSLRMAR